MLGFFVFLVSARSTGRRVRQKARKKNDRLRFSSVSRFATCPFFPLLFLSFLFVRDLQRCQWEWFSMFYNWVQLGSRSVPRE